MAEDDDCRTPFLRPADGNAKRADAWEAKAGEYLGEVGALWASRLSDDNKVLLSKHIPHPGTEPLPLGRRPQGEWDAQVDEVLVLMEGGMKLAHALRQVAAAMEGRTDDPEDRQEHIRRRYHHRLKAEAKTPRRG